MQVLRPGIVIECQCGVFVTRPVSIVRNALDRIARAGNITNNLYVAGKCRWTLGAEVHIVRDSTDSSRPAKVRIYANIFGIISRSRYPGGRVGDSAAREVPVVNPFTYDFAARVIVLTGCLVENP